MTVTRTYLEMRDQARFRPAWTGVQDVRVDRVLHCPVSFYRYLYSEVGRAYRWQDRLHMSDAEISTHLEDPSRTLWVMYVENAPAGYAEIRRESDGSAELAYFGLVPEYVGRGLGKHLLSVVVERIWEEGAGRIWLHTCTLDHPSALPNYIKRGFVPFRTEVYEVD